MKIELSVGFLHVHLHAQQSLFAHLVQELVHHLQRVQVARFVERRAFQHAHQSVRDFLEDVQRIGHQKRAGGRAGDEKHFGRLKQYGDMALFHQEPADDRRKDQENAYDGEHACPPGASVMWFPPA